MAMATSIPLIQQPMPRAQRLPLSVDSAVPWRKVLSFSLGPMLLLALRLAPAPLNQVSYPLLAVYSLLGRRQAILALFLLFLFNTFTHAFGLPPGIAGLFRHINVLTAAVSVLVIHVGRQPRSTIPRFLVWTAAMSALLLAHSAFVSTFAEISVLKAITFTLAIQTLLVAWSSLTPDDRSLVERQIFGFLAAIAVCSLPLVFVPQGYKVRTDLFQGLLVHPQNLGPTMGYLATWIAASWLTSRKTRMLPLALLAVALFLLYLSRSRIGLVVLAAGFLAALAAGPLTKAVNRWRDVGRIRTGRLVLAAVLLGLVSIPMAPRIYDGLTQFLRKDQGIESAFEAIVASREFMIEKMSSNIRERPMTGIGFGIPSRRNEGNWWGYARDPIFGLPIMAAVEKGVLPVAMVEEMGYPLAILYGLWLTGLLWLSARAGIVPAGICAAALATGAAEASFFSPGGAGLVMLVLATMAATAGCRAQAHINHSLALTAAARSGHERTLRTNIALNVRTA